MKDLGELRYLLGIEVDRNDTGIFISQQKYLTDLLRDYHMLQCKATESRLIITSYSLKHSTPLPNLVLYQQLIGKLIYLTITCPNITYAMHLLRQFMHKPTNVHMQAAKYILRYLNPLIRVFFSLPLTQLQ